MTAAQESYNYWLDFCTVRQTASLDAAMMTVLKLFLIVCSASANTKALAPYGSHL